MAEYLRAVGERQELERALEAQQLDVHFQPIVDLHSGVVRGAEALLRWDHPTRGVLPAAEFLPAYETSPVMSAVTGFVLERACRAVVAHAPPSWTVSVNLTAADAGRVELVDQVAEALETVGLAGSRLVLEVTETGLLSSPRDSADVLTRLGELGVRVSLDDFGTGYSSLRLLRELPISELKIDALFVAEMETTAADAAIVTNVIRLAEAFGAAVVAEGVERLGQAALLEQLGCAYAQGYLWSRPAPLEQVLSVETARPGRRAAAQPARVVVDRVSALLAGGASPHSVAAALNADGLRTPDGKRWHARSVTELARRLGDGTFG